jgi:hypothetical protein
MSALTTPLLALPLLAASQAQKHVTLNEALGLLDALVHLAVVSGTVAAPPSAPAEGECHLVAASASGAWTGRAGDIALWQSGAWTFLVPKAGWTAWVADETRHRIFDGAQWRPLADALGALSRLSVGAATASASVPFAVGGEATLLSHAGAGHRVTINKNADGDTASLIFQTAFAGTVEIGTAGNNDLAVKTSPSAGLWADRLVIRRTTGDIGIGVSAPTARLHVEGPVRTGSATVAGLPSAAASGAGTLVYVSDAAGGAIHAFSDGSAWRRVDTRAVVS